MSARTFVDTNVWVYCFDASEPRKQERAQSLVGAQDGRAAGELVLSTQVLAEFYVTVVRKLTPPLPESEAEAYVGDLSELEVVEIDRPLVKAAMATARRYRLSLWDSLILQAALRGGCQRLLSEDLQDGFVFDGVRIENPFKDLRTER